MRRARDLTHHTDMMPKRETGQTISEFALTAPILFALLAGILLLAWIGYAYVTITSAARMGARHMLSYPIAPEDRARFGTDADAEITHVITAALPMLDETRVVINISPAVSERVPGTQISVQVTYPLGLPTIRIPYIIRDGAFTLLPPLALDAVARMWLE